MAKDNEFIEGLQEQVTGADTLKNKREKLLKKIEEMESNVVKDPKALENLKKQLAAVEKQIKKAQDAKAVEQGNVVAEAEQDMDEDKKEKEEQEEEKKETVKDEQDLNEKEQEEEKQKELELRQAYHDSLVAYYSKRAETFREQNEKRLLVSSREDYERELELEDKMYIARDEYMLLGKSDPYIEKRIELKKQEKQISDKVHENLNRRAREYRELEKELAVYNKQINELKEQLDKATGKDIEVLEKQIDEIQIKRDKISQKIIEVKTDLGEAITELQKRAIERSGRSGLETRNLEMMSYEERKNHDYLKENIAKRNNDFKQAEKLENEQVRITIEQREERIKQLQKELKEIPETDFESRLKKLKELDDETYELKNAREAKADLDRGIALPEIKAKQEIEKKSKERIEREKEFNKATDDTREVIEEQQLGKKVVENPEQANKEEQDRDLKAATVAMVVKPDGPVEDLTQFAVAKCVISGLEKQKRDIDNNPEDAKAYLEHASQIEEAQQELKKVQKIIEQKAQTA